MTWNDLLDHIKDNHVFVTSEWLTSWWKYYGINRKLILLGVEDKNKILAVAPLMGTTYKLSKVRLGTIEFVGTPSSDYHTFMFTEKISACGRMLLSHLKTRLDKWDCMELKDIPEMSETAAVLRGISGNSLELKERKMDPCPAIPLPRSFEEYLSRLGRSTRKKLGQWERRLGRVGKIEIKEYNEIGSVERAMRIFFELHQKRFEAKNALGLFVNPAFRDFHIEVARRFAEKGWLRLIFLTLDSQPISAAYGFSYRNKLYYYLPGFNPRYQEYGVGNLTTKHLVRLCIEEGLEELDLMRGGHAYKFHWNTITRGNIELSSIPRRPVSKAYEWFIRSNILPPISKRLRERALGRTIQDKHREA